MPAQARALQKPLRLGHSHASMAATLALHGFAGAASEHPLERVESNKRKRVRTRGILPPAYAKRTASLQSSNILKSFGSAYASLRMTLEEWIASGLFAPRNDVSTKLLR